MIAINVVLVDRGVYIGVSFADRWNMATLKELGRELGLSLDINTLRTRGQIDRLRRTLKGLGFALRVKSRGAVSFQLTPEEIEALTPPKMAVKHAKTG